MGDTKIEWTNKTWNPVRGCSVVSEGCRNCYAMNFAARFAGEAMPYEGLAYRNGSGAHWTGKVRLIEEHLEDPLRWKKPCRIFVNSMSDLFHESIPDEWTDRIFAVMMMCPQHTFQVLTKRPERMLQWFQTKDSPLDESRTDIVMERAAHLGKIVWDARGNNPDLYLRATKEKVANRRAFPGWPLPNVWLGTSCEDQKTADERIPLLLQTPAAVRWISAEPLLGPIDLKPYLEGREDNAAWPRPGACVGWTPPLDWVVVGGESGLKARPMHPDWLRSLRDQCVAAGVPFFFKQWGEHVAGDQNGCSHISSDGAQGPVSKLVPQRVDVWRCNVCSALHGYSADDKPFDFKRVGKKAAGRLLDGRTWDEFPATTGARS